MRPVFQQVDMAGFLSTLEPHERDDGFLPRVHFYSNQEPVEWVRENYRRGVSLDRLYSKALIAIEHISAERPDFLIEGYTSTQWHEVRHILKALSAVTGEEIETPVRFVTSEK